MKKGKIIIPAKCNPWPHERRVAQLLALNGKEVEFIPESNIKTPDFYINRTMYEIKSPISNKVDAVERNLTRALSKSPNIVFDSSRMKVRDNQVLCELIKRKRAGKGIKRVLFINKKGKIIDIDSLI